MPGVIRGMGQVFLPAQEVCWPLSFKLPLDKSGGLQHTYVMNLPGWGIGQHDNSIK